MLDQLGLAHETWNERYPGLLVYVGQSRTKVFAYLKDRIWQRIQWWKEKMLSKARKEILIMACAQAIPTFAMLVLTLQRGYVKMHFFICKDLSSWRVCLSRQKITKKIHVFLVA